MISISEILRTHAVAAGAERWLGDLPVLVNHLEQQWDIAVGRPLAGATEAYVAEATTGAGQPARRRATAHDERAVLVHGDVHQLNALQAGPEFKLVDPDGLLAEPECDLGTVMRGDSVELLQERARRLGARTGLDATAIWEWGVIERVVSGLHCTEIGLQPLGRQTLVAADAVTGYEMA